MSGDDVAAKSRLFFNGMHEMKVNAQAYDETARKRLRALSLELTGLSKRVQLMVSRKLQSRQARRHFLPRRWFIASLAHARRIKQLNLYASLMAST